MAVSIQELLGLPPDVTQPNAYQLFGLELGESDEATINAAIARRIASLKAAKASAPAGTWKRAAIAVQSAQRTLQDPEAKSELDASFGIVSDPSPANSGGLVDSGTAVDPLASLLPTASAPAAPSPTPVHSPISPAASANVPPGPISPEAPYQRPVAAPEPAVHPPAPASRPAPAPVVRQRQPVRRRRSSGGLIFGTFALLLLAAIVGGMGYFLVYGPGEVQFVKTNDGFQIKTGGQPAPTSVVGPPREITPSASQQTSDGILKSPEPIRSNPANSLGSEMNQPGMPGRPGMPQQPAMPEMSSGPGMSPDLGMPADASMDLGPKLAEPTGPMPPPAKPTAIKESAPPSEAEISVGQLSIKTAVDAIRTANWTTMKSLAEMAETKAVTPTQKQEAETVYQYADLATFYRGGIQKALADLPTNSEIKVTETRKVLVNEADEQHLKINLGKDASGKPNLKNYLLDELPLVLAHELASYKVDINSPEGQAAKAAYQAIASLATSGHREESVRILRGLNQVEGADPKRLADFIETLGQ